MYELCFETFDFLSTGYQVPGFELSYKYIVYNGKNIQVVRQWASEFEPVIENQFKNVKKFFFTL